MWSTPKAPVVMEDTAVEVEEAVVEVAAVAAAVVVVEVAAAQEEDAVDMGVGEETDTALR